MKSLFHFFTLFMTIKPKQWANNMAYGLLGLPLAMAALPVYVQIPNFYSTQLGLDLATTGWILFLARLVDTAQDPILGYKIDTLAGKWTTWLWCGALILALAFWGLWLPPFASGEQFGLTLWLALMLILAYTAHSMLNITYLTWGAFIEGHHQNRNANLLGVAAWREGAGLFGVIAASLIPSLILNANPENRSSYLFNYSLSFALILMLAVWMLLRFATPVMLISTVSSKSNFNPHSSWQAMKQIVQKNIAFRQLLLPYFLNAVSVAIPSTLALFFINDRLQAASQAGAFFACYFLAAAIGLPFWVAVANKIGTLRAWRWGMILAILAFCGAVNLGAGDEMIYFAVCVAAGFGLGADLALPPVLLAHIIQETSTPASYFGLWA
ncbi:MAG: MFS transporter, partial [Neisseriaceae bacterium]|nr:MFS transporter [Neisseriaceae bacterium]